MTFWVRFPSEREARLPLQAATDSLSRNRRQPRRDPRFTLSHARNAAFCGSLREAAGWTLSAVLKPSRIGSFRPAARCWAVGLRLSGLRWFRGAGWNSPAVLTADGPSRTGSACFPSRSADGRIGTSFSFLQSSSLPGRKEMKKQQLLPFSRSLRTLMLRKSSDPNPVTPPSSESPQICSSVSGDFIDLVLT